MVFDFGVSRSGLLNLLGLVSNALGLTDAQTPTNKTINTTDNIITSTSRATGDILKDNGTKQERFARGAANLPLKVKSDGSDLEYAKLDVPGGGTGQTTLSTGTVLIGAGTSGITTKANPAGAFLGDSDTQNITGPKTFSNTTLKKRNPAGTFTLTEVHPAITSDKERRAYQPYHFLVYSEGGIWYVKNGLTEAIDNSSATATTMIQWAMDNLTASRTNKEVVKVLGLPSITKLTTPSYTKLDLSGSRFLQIANTDTAMFENSDTTAGNTDIEIEGGFIDGNRANQTGGGTEAISMFRFVKCSNINIHDGTYIHANYHCFRFNDCPTNIRVTNNRIENFKQEGVCDQALNSAVGVCHHHIVANNYFAHTADGAYSTAIGSCAVASVNVNDFVFANNVVNGINGGSMVTVNGLRQIVTGNTISNGAGGVGVVGTGTTSSGIVLSQGATIFKANGSIISNNTLFNMGKAGIHVQNADQSKDIIISNNTVKDCGLDSTASGIIIQDADDCIVIGNRVEGASAAGITINGNNVSFGLRNCIVEGNLCKNNGKGLDAVNLYRRAGITAMTSNAGVIDKVLISGNICYDDQGTQTQKYGVYIQAATNCVVEDNLVSGNLTAGVGTTGTITGTVIRRNVGYLTENIGSSTQSGDNTTKVFNIPHGLAAAPTYPNAVPSSDDAMGVYKVTSDATNIIVTYAIAPASGSSNLIWKWRGEV